MFLGCLSKAFRNGWLPEKYSIENERTHLNKVLVSNGYPESFINQATSRHVQKSISQKDDDSSKHETMVVYEAAERRA